MNIMEIVIDSKRNNPLLNRTEIYFTVKHEGEGTPNREIIRSELAEKINVNKEKVIINTVQSSFGTQEISCYAKIYPSLNQSKDIERNHILKRNKLIEVEKGKAEKPEKVEKKPEEAPKTEVPEEKQEDKVETDSSQEPSVEEKKPPEMEKPEENNEDTDKTQKEKEKTDEENIDESSKEESDKKTENISEEKKE